MTKPLLTLLLGLGCLLQAACGGGSGGGDGGPPPAPPGGDPFGLSQRQALASFNLPLGGAAAGSFDLLNAFPNLSFSAALYVTAVPGEDRLVVVEQGGRIVAFANQSTTSDSSTVLDIASRIEFSGEQGLLGLAFDPDFGSNRFVYLHYSVTGPRRSVIARMQWDTGSDRIEESTEKIILEVDQPFGNHNGGMLAFGPDGYLYIALGDGGSGGDPLNHGQDRRTLLGSMLRLDVHPQNPGDPYDVPLDNPFVGEADVRPEIYAYGLRNPFRFSFDRQTGTLWLGDVGQGAIEEIDIIEAGGNYGWRVFEGSREFDDSLNTLPNSAFTPPVFEYDHSLGVAVIGGYVYRGNQLGSLFGKYLYTDFASGTVWALTWDGSQVTANEAIASASSPTSFGETHGGEILLVSRNDGLFRFEPGGGGSQVPALLSQTGLFTSLAGLTPASGLIEYAPNHPFWSDGTQKRRWVGIPDSERIAFSDDDWHLPVGSVAVKHFEINLVEGDPNSVRRLETRVLLHSEQGWQGFTYRWNSAGSDATLLTGRETETLTVALAGGGSEQRRYDYPSRTDCLLCHTAAAGFTLGLTTRQLNGDFDYAGTTDNQLRSWNHIGLFDSDIGAAGQYPSFAAPGDINAGLAARARAYLDVNCSQCHRPDGPAPTALDLRASTALDAMNAVGAAPLAGDLGVAGAAVIAAGDKQRSVLWLRLQRLDGERMPPLSSHLIDTEGATLIGEWIDTL